MMAQKKRFDNGVPNLISAFQIFSFLIEKWF